MPMSYVEPEEAFDVRIQLTEEQIKRWCALSPENDRQDFDNRGGLDIPVYHVYKDNNIAFRTQYWYTIDKEEDPEHEFDIRNLPNFVQVNKRDFTVEAYHLHYKYLQEALDHNFAWFNGHELEVSRELYDLHMQMELLKHEIKNKQKEAQ